MTIRAISADGVAHEFPDNTPQNVIDGTMRRYALEQGIKRGSFTGAAMTALTSEILGAAGGIESLGRAALNLAGANVSPTSVLPTPARVENFLNTMKLPLDAQPFGKEQAAAHPIGTAVGQALPLIMASPVGVGKAAIAAYDALSGAKALGDVGKIGEVTDASKLGGRMVGKLRPNYDALYAARAKKLESVAPAAKYVGASPADQAALNAARVQVYNSPVFSDLKAFEQSPLGRSIIQDTTKFSNVPRLDPAQFPKKAFASKASVDQLRDLLAKAGANHPQTTVEDFAGEYVATKLSALTRGKSADEAAKAVSQWAASNTGWLDEVPLTKAGVSHFAGKLRVVARNQRIAKSAGKVALRAGEIAGGVAIGKHIWDILP